LPVGGPGDDSGTSGGSNGVNAAWEDCDDAAEVNSGDEIVPKVIIDIRFWIV